MRAPSLMALVREVDDAPSASTSQMEPSPRETHTHALIQIKSSSFHVPTCVTHGGMIRHQVHCCLSICSTLAERRRGSGAAKPPWRTRHAAPTEVRLHRWCGCAVLHGRRRGRACSHAGSSTSSSVTSSSEVRCLFGICSTSGMSSLHRCIRPARIMVRPVAWLVGSPGGASGSGVVGA